ncbi:MAG: PHP domain-containing protein [Blautia sp.]
MNSTCSGRRTSVFENEDTLHLDAGGNSDLRGKRGRADSILEKIFTERCGMSLKIHVDYKEAVESKARRNGELKIQQEVEAILNRLPRAAGGEEQSFFRNQNGKSSGSREQQPEGGGIQRRIQRERRLPARVASRAKDVLAEETSTVRCAVPTIRMWFMEETSRRKPSPIDQIQGEMGEVVVHGQLINLETRDIRNEKSILIFEVTDFTDTIIMKMFARTAQVPEILEGIQKGRFYKIKGVTTIDKYDSQLTIGSIVGMKKIPDFRPVRMDNSPEKRVELHCHTKMSDMDGVSDVEDIVKRAYAWGQPAIAITDHGVVQSFPAANHTLDSIDDAYRKQYQKEHPDVSKDELKKLVSPFKIIYGVEAYLLDDLRKPVENPQGQSLDSTYVVFDLETTGFSPVENRIIEIGAVKVENGRITEKFSTFCQSGGAYSFPDRGTDRYQ